jgi:pyrroloquinoline quinone (PQQ) biosynthesis protein C
MSVSLGILTVREDDGAELRALATSHACAQHPLFERLHNDKLSLRQLGALLRNYDAHASVLRRLLLHAATIMPEEAVGYILENVRNEYGNGDPSGRHQLQLRDLATIAGIPIEEFMSIKIEDGVRDYVKQVVPLYEASLTVPPGCYRPAISAGAITATEILAMEEFKAMQKAFAHYNLAHHEWFDHVSMEAEHANESLALALYFIERKNALESVRFGMNGMLQANCRLYDGFLNALDAAADSEPALHKSLTKAG